VVQSLRFLGISKVEDIRKISSKAKTEEYTYIS
jgi:hypothetical protein